MAELSWDRVDLSSHEAGLDAVDRQLERLRATNVDLRALEAQLDRARRAKQLADDKLAELRASLLQREDHVARILREVETLTAILSEAPDVPDEVAKHLDLLSDELMAEASGLDAAMRQHLHERDSKLSARLSRVSQQAVLKMTAYKKEWEAPAADWDAGLLYLPEYLGRLSTLEADRLPEFEERFFELLHRQARNNISGLAQDIRGARREIRSRVDDVNRSLLMTRFSREGRLQIKVLDRTLDEVDQFLKTLNRITESSMLDAGGAADDAARREAEERFVRMEQLLDRLGSADPADKAWRERCLDTRQHVQFQARVIDDDGAQVDVYTGSGGRSGGERQKLVTFCLAAALRFQLAPEGKADPTYALVVIDEAFDKADHTFTQAGLEVFRTFGFQLLLATPMKMLQTIDDYVGGVVMVDNRPGAGRSCRSCTTTWVVQQWWQRMPTRRCSCEDRRAVACPRRAGLAPSVPRMARRVARRRADALVVALAPSFRAGGSRRARRRRSLGDGVAALLRTRRCHSRVDNPSVAVDGSPAAPGTRVARPPGCCGTVRAGSRMGGRLRGRRHARARLAGGAPCRRSQRRGAWAGQAPGRRCRSARERARLAERQP